MNVSRRQACFKPFLEHSTKLRGLPILQLGGLAILMGGHDLWLT